MAKYFLLPLGKPNTLCMMKKGRPFQEASPI